MMARSNVVWLLVEKSPRTAQLSVASFTVEYELKTYLDRNRWRWGTLRLFRITEGPHPVAGYREKYEEPTVEELSITDLMR